MGIDVHGLNLLRFAAAHQPLGDVVTIGRQGLNVAPYRLRDLIGADQSFLAPQRYCEQLLIESFGATSVASVDNSDYEGATIIADMNVQLPTMQAFDTVVDAGTLEHIFDVRQALANVAALCAPGGQILHVLPANNQNGHGFWQFSPELFLSLYSASNGYCDTRIFLASEVIESRWYEVVPPPPGERVNLTSFLRTIVLVRTVRGPVVSDENVQQSDYLHRWSERLPSATSAESTTPSAAKRMIDRYQPVSRAVRGSYYKARTLQALGQRLSRRHPNLRAVSVDQLLATDTGNTDSVRSCSRR